MLQYAPLIRKGNGSQKDTDYIFCFTTHFPFDPCKQLWLLFSFLHLCMEKNIITYRTK